LMWSKTVRALLLFSIMEAHNINRPASRRFHSLVMEYVSNTEWKVLYNRMTDQDIKHYTFQLLRALEFSHQHGIMHRDVKPGNIVIDVRSRKVLLRLLVPLRSLTIVYCSSCVSSTGVSPNSTTPAKTIMFASAHDTTSPPNSSSVINAMTIVSTCGRSVACSFPWSSDVNTSSRGWTMRISY
jgi:serine/threonine protein kinase